MESWQVLPLIRIDPAGPVSAEFLRRGCITLRDAGEQLHALPYGRNADRADWRLVFAEGRGTCSTKHALLAELAAEQRIDVVLTLGIYDMSERNTPGVGDVLAAQGLGSLPEAHCYVRFAGHRVDITRAVHAQEPIVAFHREWAIAPDGIGAKKIELHRQYLRGWLAEQKTDLALDELWAIRERCIVALSR